MGSVRTLAVHNRKGGSGKTSTVLGLAAAAAAILPVHIYDVDEDGALDRMVDDRPAWRNITASRWQGSIDGASEPARFVFLDIAAGATDLMPSAIAAADAVLIPVSKNSAEVRNALRVIKSLNGAKPYAVIVNKYRPSHAAFVEELRGELGSDVVWDTVIPWRQVYESIEEQGLPPQRMPGGRPVDLVEAYNDLMGRVASWQI